MVHIINVLGGSIGKKAGIKSGEKIISINNNDITDVLDYQFYCTETKLDLAIADKNNRQRHVKIKKNEYDDLGLEFETYLMDKQRPCKNNCVFCFIDQLPKGMRETLYFKDDDSRLSFLFGNYITLTNISEEEIKRIIKMHISPINISVHTTNPLLRTKMMNNRFAGENLKYVEMLANAGIKMNCQLVLCRDLNDGAELSRSIEDLIKFYPNIESIAAVPVGITQYRDGLFSLKPYDKQSANSVIEIINSYGDKLSAKHGRRVVYPADEFFNLAELEMPAQDYYDEMSQLENGVGMSALIKAEFKDAVDNCSDTPKGNKKTIATGVGSYQLIKSLVDYAKNKWHNINCEVVPIKNDFFGELITTAGLITGKDLINQLKGINNLENVLISSTMIKNDSDVFLDDLTIKQVSDEINAAVIAVENNGEALLNALMD